jgi:hypothetical protein
VTEDPSLTPRFSGVIANPATIKTVLTIFHAEAIIGKKTVETVLNPKPFETPR